MKDYEKNYQKKEDAKKRRREKEIKNFKLLPAEESLINLMEDANKRKKPYEEQIQEIQKLLDSIDQQRNGLEQELKDRMGKKRYSIYQDWSWRKLMNSLVSLTPLIAMVSVIGTIVELLGVKDKVSK